MFLFHREVPVKSIAFVGIGLIMLIGLGVGVYIVNTQQTDSRSKASTAGSATLQNFVSGVGSSISLNTQPFGVSDRNTSNIEATTSNCCGGNVMKVTYDSPSDVENRFEIVFPEKIVEVLGLGTLDQLESPNTPYLPDTLADNEFGAGHLQMGSHDEYNGDRGRMKTPMVVFPTKKLLIAYLYNDLTQIRFERAAKTTLVIKKNTALKDSTNKAKVLVVRGATIEEVYINYYKALKEEGYFFKKPNYAVFGPYLETYMDMSCTTNRAGYEKMIASFTANGIRPTLLTIGSGYWEGATVGCTSKEDEQAPVGPTTEAFVANSERWNGANGLRQFIQDTNSRLIAPVLIGMRYQTWFNSKPPKYTEKLSSILQKYQSQYPRVSQAQLWFNDGQFLSGSNPSLMSGPFLNLRNNDAIKAWHQAVLDNYGPVGGYKEDNMGLMNQSAPFITEFITDKNTKNDAVNASYRSTHGSIPESAKRLNMYSDLIPNSYKVLAEMTNAKAIVVGRNDSFGVGTDAQNTSGYVPYTVSWMREYQIKYWLQAMFTQIASGYPTPVMEYMAYPCVPTEIDPDNWTQADVNKSSYSFPESLGGASPEKQAFRVHQLQTFLPVAMYSCDYNSRFTKTAENDGYKRVMNVYGNLRNRLQDYAYDQAQVWYDTGVPTLMKPLLLESDYSALAEPKNMLAPCGFVEPDPSQVAGGTAKNCTTDGVPAYQYMFGNALMVRPIMSAVDTVAVYLPPGKWRSFMSANTVFDGGKTIKYAPKDINDYPVFLKEGEIVLMGDPNNSSDLSAYAFLETAGKTESSVYRHRDAKTDVVTELQVIKQGPKLYLKQLGTTRQVAMTLDANGIGYFVAKLSTLATAPATANSGTVQTPSTPPAPKASATPLPSLTPVNPGAPKPTAKPVPTPATSTMTDTAKLTMQYYLQLNASIPSKNDSKYRANEALVAQNNCAAAIRSVMTLPTFQKRKGPGAGAYSDAQYVTMLSKAILSHNPDKAQLKQWTDFLVNKKYTRDSIIDIFINSTTAQTVCTTKKLYRATSL